MKVIGAAETVAALLVSLSCPTVLNWSELMSSAVQTNWLLTNWAATLKDLLSEASWDGLNEQQSILC